MSPVARRSLLAASLGASLTPARAAWSQTSPRAGGPVRIIVPFPPGGSVDTLARLLQAGLQQALGTSIVIENRSGAGGAIGAAAAARAAPDGQTILFVFDSFAVAPALLPDAGYDARRDFAPIMLLGTAPMLVTTPKSRPWTSFAGVIEAARARPETITYGTIGNGSLAHLTMTQIQQATGIRLTHVPYRGGGPLSTAAAGGEVDLPMATHAGLGGQVGQSVRPIAQTGRQRSALFPDVPTLAESGVPGLDARAWWGALAPAGTPPAALERFHAALASAMAAPEVRARLGNSLGIDPVASAPDEFGRFLETQIEQWGAVVRQHNIRAD
ncbi:tripartite tricarboxylate transporter substrate-binding protein [Teichococcus vastitatis]|uniref:Tripartite tricarboxylate transporter substrate binding protein n=1 Tax=Teichococcus vastitatis TaxID=2307076 RepID=A0ABS9W062_9PROT|nr:tripartite tricarboxylate transporter substrate-binding protein [Pseudoroseomonas vastitatis]MCI0752235.1 tripartite tricarboxylate transporter substrate binding protein [Pseudoroseomonas vastitatis]